MMCGNLLSEGSLKSKLMRIATVLAAIIACVHWSIHLSAADPETFKPPVTCLAVSVDGDSVVDGSQAGLRIRRWRDFVVTDRLESPCSQVHDCRFSSDGSWLVVTGGEPGQHTFVGVYSWPTLEQIWSREFTEDVAYAVSFDKSGDRLALAGHDHRVHLLNAGSGKTIGVLNGHSKPVRDISWLNDGNILLSCSIDQTIRVWDFRAKKIVRSLNNHTRAATALAVRPGDGALPMVASVGEDRTVQ